MITGERFGLLVVLETYCCLMGKRPYHRARCRCDCGRSADVRKTELTRKRTPTRSCGCLARGPALGAKRAKHGACPRSGALPEYKVWTAMRQRCLNPRERSYPRYGGRGISVHPSWLHSFETFLRDMGLRPSPDHSIDRVDNDGNYEPSNCRWATRSEQIYNRRKFGASRYRGVTPSGSGWAARASAQHHSVYLGTHATPELAAKAVDAFYDANGIVCPRNFPRA